MEGRVTYSADDLAGVVDDGYRLFERHPGRCDLTEYLVPVESGKKKAKAKAQPTSSSKTKRRENDRRGVAEDKRAQAASGRPGEKGR